MYSHEVQIRVRYAETDQMGYVYYGNYSTYYEVARVEALRNLGISYKELEETGVMMPVLENRSKYIRPAKYDNLLTVKLFLKNKPATRIRFEYEIYNEENTLLHIGETTLVFVDMKTGRPCEAPAHLMEVLESYFKE
jgi:acyl-CoA thioester hydrolase